MFRNLVSQSIYKLFLKSLDLGFIKSNKEGQKYISKVNIEFSLILISIIQTDRHWFKYLKHHWNNIIDHGLDIVLVELLVGEEEETSEK